MNKALTAKLLARAAIGMVVLLVVQSALAASVEDYAKRINSAHGGVAVLIDNIASEEAGERINEPNDEVYSELRRILPARETVETEGGSFEVDNKWFVDGLDSAERSKDLAERAKICTDLFERLGAISDRMAAAEVDRAAGRSKDQDKQKLAEILQRPEYQKPEEQKENFFTELLVRFFRWLEDLFPKMGPMAPNTAWLSDVIVFLKWTLIVAGVLLGSFLIYKFGPRLLARIRGEAKEAKPDRVILGERISADMVAADIFADAERLAREGDLRGALRKGYIALLCELSDRKLIGLAQHKTNRDYLRDVRPRRELYDRMSGLTGSFELHWYGAKDVERSDWDAFREGCGEAIRSV